MKHHPMEKRRIFRKWWWFVVPIAIALAWFGGRILDHVVKSRLQEVGNSIVSDGYTFSIDRVRSHLFEGSIDVIGIRLNYDTAKVKELEKGDVREVLDINADILRVHHVSYWDLLFKGEVKFKLIELDQPFIKYYFKPIEEELAEDV